MNKNYFSIERNGQCWSPVMLKSRNGNSDFSNFLDMTYDEVKLNEDVEKFVVAAMDATNEISGTADDQTVVTLIGDDDVFIWSIVMGPGEGEDINYSFVNWKIDGKSYRYAP